MQRKHLYLLLATLVLVAIVWFTPDTPGLKPAGKAALGVGAFAIIVWVSQALEDALSAFVIICLLVLLKATSVGGAFAGYSSASVWIVAVGLIMAACMERCGLSKRMALQLVRLAGGSPNKLYWMICVAVAVLSFFVPSIAGRTLLLLPILIEMGKAFNAKSGESNIVKGLIFVVIMSGTLMCVGVLTSHAGNPITAALIEKATGVPITWSMWFKAGAIPAFSAAFLSVPIIQWLWPSEIKDISAGQVYVDKELEALGPVTAREKYALVVFMCTLALWATDSYHRINPTLVGMFSVIAMLFPFSLQIMGWKDAERKVPWNVFVLYGAGISLGTVLVSSGAATWLAQTFFSPLNVFSIKAQVVILLWIITALQVLFTGGAAKTNALTPVIAAHAAAIGADVTPFALILGMNMVHQYLLPVSNLPNMVGLASGEITANELMKTGAIFSIYGAAFMSVMVYTYWTWTGMF